MTKRLNKVTKINKLYWPVCFKQTIKSMHAWKSKRIQKKKNNLSNLFKWTAAKSSSYLNARFTLALYKTGISVYWLGLFFLVCWIHLSLVFYVPESQPFTLAIRHIFFVMVAVCLVVFSTSYIWFFIFIIFFWHTYTGQLTIYTMLRLEVVRWWW